MQNLSEYVLAPWSGDFYYNHKTKVAERNFYLPERAADSFQSQMQYFDGGTCRSILTRLIQRADGIAVTNAGAWQVKTSVDMTGLDYREPIPGKESFGASIIGFDIVAERVAGRREVTFAAPAAIGGAVTIAGGVNLRGTQAGFNAGDGGAFDWSIVFDNGTLTFLDPGSFTNSGTVGGKDGDVYYASDDLEVTAADYTYTYAAPYPQEGETEFGIPASPDAVLIKNMSLSSITGLTAKILWMNYNADPADWRGAIAGNKDESLYPDGWPAAYLKVDQNRGTMAVARFQATRANGGLAMSAPIVMTQVGNDVTVCKMPGVYVWTENQPTSEDVWSWDPWRDPVESTSTLKNFGTNRFFLTNLVFHLSEPLGPTPRIEIAGSDDSKRVSTHFLPGRNRRMIASVLASRSVIVSAPDSPTVEVGRGAQLWLETQGENWSYGLFANNGAVESIVVREGGRVVGRYAYGTSAGQTLNLDGGEFGYCSYPGDPSYAKGALTNGDLKDFETTSLYNCIGRIVYSNGARSYGHKPYIGSQYSTAPYIRVTGTKPCFADNGFILRCITDKAVTCTLDIADATGDAEPDLTISGRVYEEKYPVTVIKKGAGTVLLKSANTITNLPIQVKEGTIAMGCDDCFNSDTAFSLEGGSLAVAAGTANALKSIAISADTTIALGDGATLTVTDPTAEWATDVTVNIVGDPEKCTLKFGDETGSLSPRQFRRIRWNGEKCHVEEDGTVVPGALGMVLLLR